MKQLILFCLVSVVLLTACGTKPEPAEDSNPIVEQVAEEPVLQPVAVSVEASIVHLTQPDDLPAKRINHAGDHDSSTSAKNKHAPGGDRFSYGEYERPFNANTMDVYFPHLDIIDTFVYQDDEWIFGVIVLKDGDANGLLSGKYGIEFDLDMDGKGDWLVIVSQPTSTEWTTAGVQVFRDTNGSVGGSRAMVSDYEFSSDGFEELVFDAGMGDDPDLAWVRVPPSDVPSIEIAIKQAAFKFDKRFMLNMWAGTSNFDPALFDINDYLTHEQAGAADRGYELFYPIKELAELDNSCKISVGFEPTGSEPGLCVTLIPKDAPGAASACQDPGCPGGTRWNQNGCSCDPIIIE